MPDDEGVADGRGQVKRVIGCCALTAGVLALTMVGQIVFLFAGLPYLTSLGRPTKASVEHQLNTELPIGVPSDQIEAWFRRQRMTYQYREFFATGPYWEYVDGKLTEKEYPVPGALLRRYEGAIVNVKMFLIGQEDLLVHVYVDEQRRVERHEVRVWGSSL